MNKNKTFKIEEVLMDNELIITGNVEDGLKTNFLDANLDPFKVDFNYDDCATIKTNGSKYISISREKLIALAKLVELADKIYDQNNEYN